MAEKKQKSQAEKAAENAKKKKNASIKKNDPGQTKIKEPKDDKNAVPVRFISSSVLLIAFIVMLVALIWPEGMLIRLFSNFVQGLIGRAGFFVLIYDPRLQWEEAY